MASTDTKSSSGLKILHASLFRMGTKSMAEAYRILGIKTFHGLDDPLSVPWPLIEQAAEATWPFVPEARPRPPFKRADWDDLWGNEYDAVCDPSGPFTLELIKAYPDAKVVLVQRDYDSWWPSFQSEILEKLFTPQIKLQLFIAWHVLGYRGGHAMTKLLFGFFNAKSKAEIEDHVRGTCEEYFENVRNIVPPERLLEYKLGSGWEPLCMFLNKDVPDVPFPRSNDRKAHSEGLKLTQRKMQMIMMKKVGFFVLGGVVLGVAWWAARN